MGEGKAVTITALPSLFLFFLKKFPVYHLARQNNRNPIVN